MKPAATPVSTTPVSATLNKATLLSEFTAPQTMPQTLPHGSCRVCGRPGLTGRDCPYCGERIPFDWHPTLRILVSTALIFGLALPATILGIPRLWSTVLSAFCAILLFPRKSSSQAKHNSAFRISHSALTLLTAAILLSAYVLNLLRLRGDLSWPLFLSSPFCLGILLLWNFFKYPPQPPVVPSARPLENALLQFLPLLILSLALLLGEVLLQFTAFLPLRSALLFLVTLGFASLGGSTGKLRLAALLPLILHLSLLSLVPTAFLLTLLVLSLSCLFKRRAE